SSLPTSSAISLASDASGMWLITVKLAQPPAKTTQPKIAINRRDDKAMKNIRLHLKIIAIQ
ncbi:MAG TPA: hypothetical protein PKE16_04075, partial [Hyphomicrobium sp.]|nr:hypothetical protein [Hyphomicrobium sp.]